MTKSGLVLLVLPETVSNTKGIEEARQIMTHAALKAAAVLGQSDTIFTSIVEAPDNWPVYSIGDALRMAKLPWNVELKHIKFKAKRSDSDEWLPCEANVTYVKVAGTTLYLFVDLAYIEEFHLLMLTCSNLGGSALDWKAVAEWEADQPHVTYELASLEFE